MRATKLSAKKKTKKVSSKSDDRLRIPDIGEIHEPSDDFAAYCYLIYGEKAMGKTTLLSQLSEKGLVCMFEDRENTPARMLCFPSKTVEEMENGEPDPWQDFKKVVEQALESDNVDMLGIDTIDMAFMACQNSICMENGYTHPNDANDYGATWNTIASEFRSVFEKVRKSGKITVVFTSHSSIDRMELNTATKAELKKYTVYSPTCSKQATDYVKKFCDFVFFYGKHGPHRGMHFRWTDNIWTACGNDNHFLDEEGTPISVLHMPSKLNAGKAFIAAFNNKPITPVLKFWDDLVEEEDDSSPSQEDDGEEEKPRSRPSKKPTKKK